MAFCCKCGTVLPNGSVFCNVCGARQAVQPFQGPEQTQYQQPYQTQSYHPQQPQQFQPYQTSMGQVATSVAKKGVSTGSKWLIATLIAALLIGSIVIVFCFTDLGNIFKSDDQLIRERIQAYEDACNNGDYEGMLDCMDSATRSVMDASMGLLDGFFSEGTGLGIGMTDLFGFAGLMGDYCDIQIIDITIDGNYAVVNIIMTMEIYGAEQQSTEAALPMVKENGNWYIGGVDNMLDSSFF